MDPVEDLCPLQPIAVTTVSVREQPAVCDEEHAPPSTSTDTLSGSDGNSGAQTPTSSNTAAKSRMALLERMLGEEQEARVALLREEHALRIRHMREEHEKLLQQREEEHRMTIEILKIKNQIALAELKKIQ